MTRILKLEAKGFKSFANRTELVFGEKFNCVIGPNGSGKSNIIDAICFVLGKGSAKGLRAEKSANLIYNGGKAKTPAKQGEASLYFDNQEKQFPIDEDVVKVTRIVKQNGSSTYKINDKTHTRAQLLDFLARANVDPDGYNIILQGDIARFTEMSGIERRQIIEEMAGIGVYEDKKQKAVRELDKVQQGINDGDLILAERQAYLKELRRERDQAIKYKEVEKVLKDTKHTLVVRSIEAKKQELEKLDERGKKRNEEIKKHEQTIRDTQNSISERTNRVSEINKEIEEKGEKQQVELNKDIEALKVTLATDKHRIGACENEIKRVEERIDGLEANKKDLQEKMRQGNQELQDITKQLETKTNLTKELQTKISTLKEKFNLDAANGVEQEIEQIDKKADELQKQIATLREAQQDRLREKDRLEVQIEHMDEKIAKVKELEAENKQELAKLKQMRTEFKKATVELSQSLSENTKITSELSRARQQSQSAAEDLARIQAREAATQELQGGDIAIKKILENKKELSGVRGTVASLGVVDKKFSVALEVAAGNKLKAIVVEDDKNAANCINYLRTGQFGVATFFPMNKIKAPKKNPDAVKAAQAKGALGLATDLIEFSPEYKSVMEFVFGNTVVVESLDVARRIGIGTCKMVTLDGDAAERSGSMRGGYKKKRASGSVFSEKHLKDQRDRAENALAETQGTVSVLEEKKNSNEEQIVRLRDLKANLEGDIIKLEKSLYISADDIGVNSELKKEFSAKLKEIDASLEGEQDKVMDVTRELAQLKVRRQQLRAEVSDIRNPTKLAELNTFEEQLTKTREDIARLDAKKEQSEQQTKQMFAPELENIDKIIKQHQKETAQFVEEKKGLEKGIATKTKDLSEKEKQQEKFYKQFKSLLEERNNTHVSIERDEQRIISWEEKIQDLQRQGNSVNIEIARVKAELTAFEEELQQIGEAELLEEVDVQKLKRRVWDIQQRLDNMGNVNMKALETYERIQEEYDILLEKKAKLEAEKNTIEDLMFQIEDRKKEIFLSIFNVLNDNFKKLFQSLSSKGDAYLELENPDEPFEGGAYVKVRLSGKKFMDIRSLSGGEKSMTALAFIFSILEYMPSPYYVLDEVDAALDKKNAERLADLVERFAKTAQFIVISHNDGVISEADTLYGVSMDEHGMSNIVSVKL